MKHRFDTIPDDDFVRKEFLKSEYRDMLWKIVQQLKPNDAQCLTLWSMGYSPNEIASKLGVALQTAKNRTNLAKQNLRDLIKNSDHYTHLINEIKISLNE